MNRRKFIKAALATSTLYAASGLPTLGRVASADGVPALDNRVLVNVMMFGGPDFRHLFPPPFDSKPGSYGYEYWAARAGSHSIAESVSAYQSRWFDDYFHVSDGATDFGILSSCGWLKRMWDAGNVAIITNAVGGTTRNHSHCRLIMEQGNLRSGPNDFERSGWGGRLAYYAGGNVLSLSTAPTPFSYGPHPEDPEKFDNRNLISARNTRKLSLYEPSKQLGLYSSELHIANALSSYYAGLRQEENSDSVYRQFVEQERLLREFGEPIEDRLSTVALPGSIVSLMEGGLSDQYLGEQVRSLYDSFVCSDILSQRAVYVEVRGWDTHRNQREVIEPKLEDLFGEGRALDVLYTELPISVLDNTVFVLGGEFGRQLRANGDYGTDHGVGTSILVIGNRVKGGVYGKMFPEDELHRLGDSSPDIDGRTTIDTVYSSVCDWVEPGSSGKVFPDKTLSMVEDDVNIDALFL